MAADPLDTLRLKLMQEVLPVGVAVVERARRGGLKDVVAAFQGSRDGQDPLGQLRDEGEPLASQLRDGLDRLQPGLGNPVMKVDVRVEQTSSVEPLPQQAERAALQSRLAAMAERLALLEQHLGQG
jgi:hypothetical protein